MKKLLRWSQAGNACGINEEKLITLASNEGLTNENGNLTERALNEGIFILKHQGQTTITADKKRKALIQAEVENIGKKEYDERQECVLLKIECKNHQVSFQGKRSMVIHTTLIF